MTTENFKPESPTDLLLGMNEKNKTIKYDLKENGNVLIYGCFGAGKSTLTQQIIASTMSNWSSKKIQFALYSRKDLDMFEEVLNGDYLCDEVKTNEEGLKELIDIVYDETISRNNSNENGLLNYIMIIDELAYASVFIDIETTRRLEYILENGPRLGVYIIATVATPFIYDKQRSTSFRQTWESYFNLLVLMRTESNIVSESLIGSDELMFLEVGTSIIIKNDKTFCINDSVF